MPSLQELRLKSKLFHTAMLPNSNDRANALAAFWEQHLKTCFVSLSFSKDLQLMTNFDKAVEHEIRSAHRQIADEIFKQKLSIIEDVPEIHYPGHCEDYPEKELWAEYESRKLVKVTVVDFR